jgi:hypothetical protein
MKKSLKIVIYLPDRELVIEKYIKGVQEQEREIEDAIIVEEYKDKIEDRELPLFVQEY